MNCNEHTSTHEDLVSNGSPGSRLAAAKDPRSRIQMHCKPKFNDPLQHTMDNMIPFQINLLPCSAIACLVPALR
jgi:hypothetical protein